MISIFAGCLANHDRAHSLLQERTAAVVPTKNTAAEPTGEKRWRTTRAATHTQAFRRTPDALAAALEGVPERSFIKYLNKLQRDSDMEKE